MAAVSALPSAIERPRSSARFVCFSNTAYFRGATRGAVFGDDLKKNLHSHDGPPLLIAGGRAFHNRRSGKLETDPARRPPATLARMGTPKPQVCTPETLKQTGSWPLSNVSPPPSPPSSCVKASITRKAKPFSKPQGSEPGCGRPRNIAAASIG